MPLYQSPYTAAIAQQMQEPARIQAQALERNGATQANALLQGAQFRQQAAGAIGTSLRDLATTVAKIPEAQVNDLKLKQMAQDYGDQQAVREALTASKGDVSGALNALDAAGKVTAATQLRGQVTASQIKGLEKLKLEMDTAHKGLETAGGLFAGVKASKTPAEEYGRILPDVARLVGPEIAAKIPKAYDPQFVDDAMSWGMTASQHIQARARIAQEARNAIATSVTNLDLHQKMADNLGRWAQTVSDQGEWDQMLRNAKALGTPQMFLDQIGATYSDAAKEKAANLIDDRKTPSYQMADVLATGPDGKPTVYRANFDPKSGEYTRPGETTPLKNVQRLPNDTSRITPEEHATLVAGVIANPALWHDFTDTVKSNLAPDLVKAGFTQFGRPDNGAGVAAAERWKFNALKDLEKRFNDSQIDVGKQMSEADKEAERQRIEASYQAQIGRQRVPPKAADTPPPPPAVVAPPPPKPAAAAPAAPPKPAEAPTPATHPFTLTVTDQAGKAKYYHFKTRREMDDFVRDAGAVLKPQ